MWDDPEWAEIWDAKRIKAGERRERNDSMILKESDGQSNAPHLTHFVGI